MIILLRLKVLKQVSNDAKGGKSPTLGCGVVTGHCCFDAGSSPWSPLHSLRPVWVAYFSFPLCLLFGNPYLSHYKNSLKKKTFFLLVVHF